MNDKHNGFSAAEIESDSIDVLSLKLLAMSSELSRKNEELARVEKSRTEMLANISHDLRAPITAIRGCVDLLKSVDEISEEDLRNSLDIIDRRVGVLECLIQDMYYLFSVEDTNRGLDIEEVALAPFLESFFYDAIVDSRYDNHDVQLDVPMNMDCKVLVDINRTKRVLDNLFTNAAKYSGEDTMIRLYARKIGEGTVEIRVIDNGKGIPKESLPKIFDRTYTVASARTPGGESGSGLGLAICKAVIEREHGAIRVESEEGMGTEFIITLPC